MHEQFPLASRSAREHRERCRCRSGLVAALALARLMSSVLFGVSPTDAVAYVAAVGVTVAAAALASYVSARRAANIDPIETLRAE